jgi:hypothetical protein
MPTRPPDNFYSLRKRKKTRTGEMKNQKEKSRSQNMPGKHVCSCEERIEIKKKI